MKAKTQLRSQIATLNRSAIETAAQAAAIFRAAMPREQKEERVFVLPLDANGKALAKPILVSVGHEDGTATIDVGAVFREALKAGAEEIIVAHNHPSGDLRPSRADIAATAKLREAGEILGVPLIDHLIVGLDGCGKRVPAGAEREGAHPPAFCSLAETLGQLP